MKRISIIFIIILAMFGNIYASATEIPYKAEKTEYSKIKDCASDGNTYVIVGTGGYIGVSSDLENWYEVKDVCYTDIDRVIWDGNNYIFITGGNVYKSNNGYDWEKQACVFIAGDDFQFVDGKYIVRKSESNSPTDIAKAKVGFTKNFTDFEEIHFEQILDEAKMSYTFSPVIYYMDGMYFAQGLISKMIYSSDLTEWSVLPELPNKNNTSKKQLLFTRIGNEYVIYFDENNSIVAYSISIDSDMVWEKHNLNMPAMLGEKILQQNRQSIFCFAPFNNAFRSNDGYNFEKIDFDTDGEFISNTYVPMKTKNNHMYSMSKSGELKVSGDIQQIENGIVAEKIWTGKEYLLYSDDKVTKTVDGINYITTDIDYQNIETLREKGINVLIWDGNRYIGRVGGYESPKLRGGALENGRTIYVFDNCLNIIDSYVFDGDVCGLSYCEGNYYVKIGSISDKEKYEIYSSDNFDKWNLENELDEIPLSNGKTILMPTYDRNNAEITTYTEKDVIKDVSAKFKSGFVPINYEGKTENRVYVFDGIYVAKMIDNDGVYIGFSGDGIYFSKVKIHDDFMQLSERVTANGKNIFYIYGDNIVYEEYGNRFIFDIKDIREDFETKQEIYVKVKNQILGFDTSPVIESDRTLVPLRFIFETLGAKVDWKAETQTAIVKDDNTSIAFSIDNAVAMVNNSTKTMDVPARLINDKTMVPLRFLSEMLGFNVEWDEEERLVTISR